MKFPRGGFLAALSCISFVAAVAANTQESGDQIPKSKPVNLQVLPKDIAPTKLGRLMKTYERDLGVKCAHCHVENPQTQKLDYVSDENPRKQSARVMISMLTDINERYLTQLGGDSRYAVPITCGSCHQGRASPPEFEGRS